MWRRGEEVEEEEEVEEKEEKERGLIWARSEGERRDWGYNDVDDDDDDDNDDDDNSNTIETDFEYFWSSNLMQILLIPACKSFIHFVEANA